MQQYTTQDFTPYRGNPKIILTEEARNFDPANIDALVAEHLAEIGVDSISQIPNLAPNFAREPIFNFLRYDTEHNELTLGITSGTMAKALQNVYKDRGVNSNHKPILVQGIIKSADGYLGLGVRGYPKTRGPGTDKLLEETDLMLMFTPAGYAKWNQEGSLLTPFYAELLEEDNLTREDLAEDPTVLGFHHDRTWSNGHRITFNVTSKNTAAELNIRQQQADHAWEYRAPLVWIPRQPVFIGNLLNRKIPLNTLHSEARGLLEGVVSAPLEYLAVQIGNETH